jgi:hypothetical protein
LLGVQRWRSEKKRARRETKKGARDVNILSINSPQIYPDMTLEKKF